MCKKVQCGKKSTKQANEKKKQPLNPSDKKSKRLAKMPLSPIASDNCKDQSDEKIPVEKSPLKSYEKADCTIIVIRKHDDTSVIQLLLGHGKEYSSYMTKQKKVYCKYVHNYEEKKLTVFEIILEKDNPLASYNELREIEEECPIPDLVLFSLPLDVTMKNQGNDYQTIYNINTVFRKNNSLFWSRCVFVLTTTTQTEKEYNVKLAKRKSGIKGAFKYRSISEPVVVTCISANTYLPDGKQWLANFWKKVFTKCERASVPLLAFSVRQRMVLPSDTCSPKEKGTSNDITVIPQEAVATAAEVVGMQIFKQWQNASS